MNESVFIISLIMAVVVWMVNDFVHIKKKKRTFYRERLFLGLLAGIILCGIFYIDFRLGVCLGTIISETIGIIIKTIKRK